MDGGSRARRAERDHCGICSDGGSLRYRPTGGKSGFDTSGVVAIVTTASPGIDMRPSTAFGTGPGGIAFPVQACVQAE
eukprot:358829-Chlamydomonas_euryale.AAC.6